MRRIGIIGLGTVFEQHLRALALLKDTFRLLAVCDVDPGRLAPALTRCEALLGPEDVIATADLDAFLRLDLDAVVIATPPQSHYGLADACLRVQKNVLVEKPAVTDIQQLLALYAMARKRGCLLQVAYHAAFGAEVLWFWDHREALERQFGARKLEQIVCCFSDPYVREGNLLPGSEVLGGSYLDSTVNELSVCARLANLSDFRIVRFESVPLRADNPVIVQSLLQLQEVAGQTVISCHTDWTQGINHKESLLRYDNGTTVLLDHSEQTVTVNGTDICYDNGAEPRLVSQYGKLYRDYARQLDAASCNEPFSILLHQLLLEPLRS